MRIWLFSFWSVLTTVFKSLLPSGAKAIVAENITLRKQLLVLSRKHKRAPNLTPEDRFILGWCAQYLSFQRIIKNAIILKPATILRFHKALKEKKYQLLYSSKSKRKPGPKGPSQDVINAILEMKYRNPRFGDPRIAQQINFAFGVSINKDVVRRVLDKHYKPTGDDQGPSWLTFLGHCKDSLWSLDFFRCESATLNSYWVMVVMDQFTRRIIGFATQKGDINGIAACRMFNEIRSKKRLPKYLSSDNDPVFEFHRWWTNLDMLDIEEVKSLPGVPTSHPFIERIIGTVRREFLDHTLFWTCSDLQRKLDQFKDYYNQNRVHSSRSGKPPTNQRSTTMNFSNYSWKSYCRGLFQLPIYS
ncbi:integrase core domain-containing protein [Teredinibacter sp. KSP-S5-2]|uniref:integrase core domain-containing protein n=1 Tax=Teredinibacter sp. KSP-S5-2 TaxID=3034506 RepID=UPI0029342DAD|nr:integrase core domain-containing protein [Teredinibacter sp. KSP-S5-2]WNO10627.1 integrase core domain-containing protein [Teredinibacter sp. KSP-S5-2]